MKDLAFERNSMYPTATSGNEKSYPHICLPLSIAKDIDVDAEVTLVLKGKVTRVEKSEYCNEFTVKITEGEVAGGKTNDDKE